MADENGDNNGDEVEVPPEATWGAVAFGIVVILGLFTMIGLLSVLVHRSKT